MMENMTIADRRTTKRMRVFILIWVGQLVSFFGSGVTSFAFGVWVYEQTNSVTQFSLISLFTILPTILISPIAGTFVDRWDRRWIMLLGDAGSGVCTLVIALLLFAGLLKVWHIYLGAFISSTCSAFQWPAYAAATSLLVPKQQLGRANGMIHLGISVGRLLSPALAGLLVMTIKIQGIILLDFITFLFAVSTLLLARFPKPEIPTAQQPEGKRSLWREFNDGWKYITTRPGLLGLLMFMATTNFLVGLIEVLATPLVLSFASPAVLGSVLSIGGSGMVVGSILMSTWGGTVRMIHSVFGFMLLNGLCIVVAGLQPSASLFTVAAFLFFLGLPIINGSTRVILHRKVPSEVQGRVFALTEAIAGSCLPLAYLVAGPLVDRVFQPLLVPGGALAGSLGQLIGVGPGRGIGLIFIVVGALTMLATVIAYQYPRLRQVEDELPDAVQDEPSTIEKIA